MTDDLRFQIIKLRLEGKTYLEIGKEISASPHYAKEVIDEALFRLTHARKAEEPKDDTLGNPDPGRTSRF